ncbi:MULTISPECIES: DUF6397 family protein [unclassified Streptomyces]|uniref:DUF6397 family protein n=1 Tax=unclassified Streptomyces TaxID=2593676 RepID=UPI001BE8AB9A|nr:MULTISPECIES: DUF6397 family protein [unclassified Streptomyces]MBT2407819.1 hypothetical protein [Streptomyces sp. ISL-21]MBT2458624.1 hypothetical protein [Streptomyces sp. ISL-86]MBT2608491.1 hypothetical protein [Streptomyces sp. ISL-87]
MNVGTQTAVGAVVMAGVVAGGKAGVVATDKAGVVARDMAGNVDVRRAAPPALLVGGAQAAGELGLRRAELARAVQLGMVRAGPRTPGGAARFTRAELDRVRSAAGFPEELRARVEAVAGADAAAEVLRISPSRFTRLARCGHVTPVGYRINRYRAVVWLYLAAELREFAAREPGILRGIAPEQDRELMAAKADLRPRKWRERHVGLLLRRTADPWERAAVLASALPEDEVREAVPDPAERIVLAALAPPPPYGHPQIPEAAAVAMRLLRAGPQDEIDWYRTSLDFALSGARGQSKSTGERGPT